jgi:hypothetical protein
MPNLQHEFSQFPEDAMMTIAIVVVVVVVVVAAVMTMTTDSWDLHNFFWKSSKQDVLMSFFFEC